MSDSIVIEESNGEIIVIEPTVVINQTTCAAEWGGITGDIGDQSDLITLFNTKENKNRTILESDNFDEVTANGKYSANYGSIMLDVANAYGQVFQRAIYQSTNEEKFRWQIGGEWNDWVKLANTDDLAKKMNVEPMELPIETDIPYINGVYVQDGVHYVRYINGNVMTQLSLEAGNFYHSISLDGGTSWYHSKRIASEDDLTNLSLSLDNKVDKVAGKGLSSNDYTTTEKNKLAGIEAGAQVNVIPTWNSVTGKPAEFPPSSHNHNHDDLDGLDVDNIRHLTEDEKTKLGFAVTSSTITEIVVLTQTAYDALNPKVPTTNYMIVGA